MNKEHVRKLLLENNLKQWELADRLGISEYTLCKRLRHPINDEFETAIREAVTGSSADEAKGKE